MRSLENVLLEIHVRSAALIDFLDCSLNTFKSTGECFIRTCTIHAKTFRRKRCILTLFLLQQRPDEACWLILSGLWIWLKALTKLGQAIVLNSHELTPPSAFRWASRKAGSFQSCRSTEIQGHYWIRADPFPYRPCKAKSQSVERFLNSPSHPPN